MKIDVDIAWNGQEAIDLYEKNLVKECNNPEC